MGLTVAIFGAKTNETDEAEAEESEGIREQTYRRELG